MIAAGLTLEGTANKKKSGSGRQPFLEFGSGKAGGSHSKEEDCQRVMLGFDYGLGVLLGHREAVDLLDKGQISFLADCESSV